MRFVLNDNEKESDEESRDHFKENDRRDWKGTVPYFLQPHE